MLRTPLVRLFVRATAQPMLLTSVLALVLLGLGGLGQALLVLSVAPGPALLLRLALGVLGSVAPVALGVGVLAGIARGVVRLREERALVALQAAGLAPLRVAGLAVALAVPGALVHLALSHQGEPMARALVRDTRAEVALAVQPRVDRAVRLGSWWVAQEGSALVFTDGVRTGRAARWSLSAARGGVLAELGGVEAGLGEGVRVEAASLQVPLPVGGRGRVHIFERTTPDLLRQIEVSARLGRDRYERWTLWKRSLLPALLLPLAAAAAGLARRWGEGPVVGGLVLGSWVVVRVLDAQAERLGPAAAAAVLGLWAAAAVAGAWRR